MADVLTWQGSVADTLKALIVAGQRQQGDRLAAMQQERETDEPTRILQDDGDVRCGDSDGRGGEDAAEAEA